MLRRKSLAALAAVSVFASSCGSSSYPKGQVAESLVKLCQAEYGIKIKAQMAKTTLGVMAPIPGLVDAMRKSAGSSGGVQLPGILVEGRYADKVFDFRLFARGEFSRVQKKPQDDNTKPKEPDPALRKLQQVSTALHRVCLSTDAPVEFYQLIARDPGPEKLDIIFSGHIQDSKRLQFWAIGMEELQARSQFSVRLQPEAVGEQTVASFLRDLRRLPLPKLLSTYTAPSRRFGEILPKMLSAGTAMRGQEQAIAEEIWFTRQIDRETILVYVPLKKVNGRGALLFTVLNHENSGSFLDIVILEDGALPNEYQHLGPPERWEDFFYLEPLSLPDFLADQIAKRVMAEFEAMEPEPKELSKEPVKKPAQKSAPKPAPKKKRAEAATPADVARVFSETAAYVMYTYEFRDFQELSLVDALRGTRWVLPAVDLPLFRRRNPPELKPVP